MHILKHKSFYYLLGICTLFVYFFPYFILGENIYLIQYDNLDSVIIWYKILTESGSAFANNEVIIPNMMNGLPRVTYPSEMSFLFLLYSIFSPLTAYVINDILIHFIAFFGMFALIERYLFTEKTLPWRYFYIFVPSLLFALVPFWPNGALSVAGQPLALYAFLNIRNGDTSLKNWLILVLLPFYSSLILSFMFFLFAIGLLWIYDVIKKKKINWTFTFAIILMGLLYLVVEYRLVYEMFIHHTFTSHRIEFDLRHNLTFNDFYKNSHTNFLNGLENTITLHYKYLLPFILTAMLLPFSKRKLSSVESLLLIITGLLLYIANGWHWLLASVYSLPTLLLFSLIVFIFSSKKLLSFLMIVQILIAYWATFWFHPWWNQFTDVIPLIKTLHFSRLIYLTDIIWYLMFALAIIEFSKKVRYTTFILIIIVFFQLHLAFQWRTFGDTNYRGKQSFKQYYSPNLFKEIENYIGKNKHSYRIVSLGIEPAVSLYNGFYTIDGYTTNYPLTYKHKFRKVIKQYLDEIPSHQGDKFIYDDWGSKVYLLEPNILSGIPPKHRKRFAYTLKLDIKMLQKLNADYLISSYEIINAEKIGLQKIKTFKHPKEQLWAITLYKVDPGIIKKYKKNLNIAPFKTNTNIQLKKQ